jgi:hypothetical protein
MTPSPISFTWDGEAMQPHRRFHNKCAEAFVIGESYMLEEIQVRSTKSHSHFFAALNDGWMNLPEDQSERFPTVEHLRKFALIKCGYADQRQIVCSSKAEAQRIASFVRPMDEYAIVAVTESVVTVWTAKSQSMRAMGAKVFQESKTAVLDYIASMIGVNNNTLQREAGRAA